MGGCVGGGQANTKTPAGFEARWRLGDFFLSFDNIIITHLNVLRCVKFEVAQGITMHMSDSVEGIM